MNNNRNNRRRGRGNRNQGGGGNAANRIDSRARGNAPQLLDKYKKLAQDAHHNGDRVQQEYYLQFADHYFRVIADNKARQDEARVKRNDERGSNDDDQGEGSGEDRRNDNRGDNRRGGNRRQSSRRDDQSSDQRGEGNEYEPEDNPFVAGENKSADTDGEKTKKRAPRRKKAEDANGDASIDAAALPPSIGADEEQAEAKPKRTRRRPNNDEDSSLSQVG